MKRKFKSNLAVWLLSTAASSVLLSSAWAQPTPRATPLEEAVEEKVESAIDDVIDDAEELSDDVNDEVREDDSEPAIEDDAEETTAQVPEDKSEEAIDKNAGHDHIPLTPDTVDFVFTEAPDDHVLGDDKAPITMIVYASVTCSHCSDWFTNQWPALKKDLVDSGKMRFVLRELPTAPAQMSMLGFMMAECAPTEDYFDVVQYQMENQLMMFKQAEIGKVRAEYDKVARLAGLEDDAAVQSCLENLNHLSHIHKSGYRATAAKVQGVPAFFINGETYKGDQSADALSKLVLEMGEQGLSKLPTTLP